MEQEPMLRPINISELTQMIPNEQKPIPVETPEAMPGRHLHHFPIRYQGIRLDTCEVTAGNKAAVEACQRWAAGKVDNLLLWGSAGTGKTHLACAAPTVSIYHSVSFIRVPEMLLEFQASVKDHGEMKLLDAYLNSSRRWVPDKEKFAHIFDDVGAHRLSDFSIEMFGLLLEKYYASCWRGLLFTSNLSPRKILETMGERISSRLCGLCESVELSGSDRRLET